MRKRDCGTFTLHACKKKKPDKSEGSQVDLPDEIILRVFSFLEISDLLGRVSFVCRHWKTLSLTPTLWQPRHLNLHSLGVNSFSHTLSLLQQSRFSTLKRLTLGKIALTNADANPSSGHSTDHQDTKNHESLLVEALLNKHSLVFLDLSNCEGISDLTLKSLPNLRHLRRLVFREADITDNGLSSLLSGGLSDLCSLSLESCDLITDRSLTLLSTGCPNLSDLSVSYCQLITNEGVRSLSSCLALRRVGLSGTGVSFDGLSSLSRLGLQHLAIAECDQIRTDDFTRLPQLLSGIQSLDLSENDNNVTDGVIEQLFLEESVSKSLQYLNLHMCQNLTDSAFSAILERNPQSPLPLVTLDLSECESISDKTLRILSMFCGSLENLDISGCSITDSGIELLAYGCRKLRSLNLWHCKMITDLGVWALAKYLSALTQLRLGSCNVSNLGVRDLAESSCTASLRGLDLSKCRISDEGLLYLQKMNSLSQLVLSECTMVSDVGLKHLSVGCRALEQVDVSNCGVVTDEGILALAALPRLRHLDLYPAVDSGDPGIGDLGLLKLYQIRPDIKVSLSDRICLSYS